MSYPYFTFEQKHQHLAKVRAVLDHHKHIVDTFQKMYDVSWQGLKDPELNPNMGFSSATI